MGTKSGGRYVNTLALLNEALFHRILFFLQMCNDQELINLKNKIIKKISKKLDRIESSHIFAVAYKERRRRKREKRD